MSAYEEMVRALEAEKKALNIPVRQQQHLQFKMAKMTIYDERSKIESQKQVEEKKTTSSSSWASQIQAPSKEDVNRYNTNNNNKTRWPVRSQRETLPELDHGEDLEEESDSDVDLETPAEIKAREARNQHRRALRSITFFLSVDRGYDMRSDEGRMVALAWVGLQDSTSSSYVSLLRQVSKAGAPLTTAGVTLLLQDRLKSASAVSQGTIKQYQAALNFYLRSIGEEGEQAQRKAIFEGLVRLAGARLRTRGSITQDMVQEMINLPSVKRQKDLVDGLIILAASGIRQNQLFDAKTSNCTKERSENGQSVWCITVRQNYKGRRMAANHDKDLECHYTNPYWGKELDRIIGAAEERQRKKSSEIFLCPSWNAAMATEARVIIKDAAKKLKWNDQLDFVLHSLRCGAACDAFMRALPAGEMAALLAVKAKTGHISMDMLRHYAIPNEDRQRFQQMKLDDAMLRATGVTKRNLEQRITPSGLALRSMLAHSELVGNLAVSQIEFAAAVEDAQRNQRKRWTVKRRKEETKVVKARKKIGVKSNVRKVVSKKGGKKK